MSDLDVAAIVFRGELDERSRPEGIVRDRTAADTVELEIDAVSAADRPGFDASVLDGGDAELPVVAVSQ